MEVIAARTMNALYMYLDVAFLLFLGATLVYTKRYLAIIVGLLQESCISLLTMVIFTCI